MSTYAFSDLHAQYNLWTQIKNFIKPEDTVYCLGDCVDRGNAGLEILNEVMETPNIILLRGNHEDFIDSIGSEVIRCEPDEDIYREVPNMYLWRMNGADNTIKAFNKLSREKKNWLINEIKKLPTHIEHTNSNGDIIYLCHAGRQPDTEEIADMGFGDVPMNNYIWDRTHLTDTKWRGKSNEYCVHGHTPIEYMFYYTMDTNEIEIPQSRFEIFKYCEDHKINIDLGSFNTHRACLLNLDTFEPIYFEDNTYKRK
jgi:serine/threonine protein phosphatase 1